MFPSPRRRAVATEDFGQSLPYFPLVGLILGAILLGLHYGLTLILPPPVVNALLIIALVTLTGAHHLDGLIDTCDGVIAGKSKEERLAIMSDSKVGAFGIASYFRSRLGGLTGDNYGAINEMAEVLVLLLLILIWRL